MHIERLKKNDIVLNHLQTEDLIKHGKAFGKGKVVGGLSAFAQGTIKKLSAFANGTRNNLGNSSLFPQININGNNNTVLTDGSKFEVNDKGPSTNVTGAFTSNGQNVNAGSSNSGGNSGGGNSGGGGGGDSGGGGGEENNDKPQYSQDIFDYVEIRLQYLADATKKIADRITDYVDKALKGKLLKQEIAALQREIEANSQAATTYMRFAEDYARNYVYTDDDGNKQTMDITQGPHKFDLTRLLRGDYNLDILETTTPEQQASVEGARAYVDYINRANDANNAIRDLTNTMRELYSQIIQLPTEKLEQALERIERRITTINGVSGAMSSGMSGIASAQRYLQMATGNTAAQKNLDKANKKVETTQTARSTANKKYQQDKAATDTASKNVKKQAGYKKLSKSQKSLVDNAIKKGGNIDINKLKSLGSVNDDLLKYIKDYNKKNTTRKSSLSALEDAKKANERAKVERDAAKQVVSNTANRLTDETRRIANASLTQPTYKLQNTYLDKEMEVRKQEIQRRTEAIAEQEKTTETMKRDRTQAKKDLKAQGNKMLKTTGITAADKKLMQNAIKNNAKIDPTKVSKAAQAAVAQWNEIVLRYNKLEEAVGEAEEAESKMRDELNQDALEAAQQEQENAKQKLENIQTYFENAINWTKSYAELQAANRKLWEELGTTGNRNEKLTDGITFDISGTTKIQAGSSVDKIKRSYEQQIADTEEMIRKQTEEASELRNELNQQVSKGTVIYGSEEWKEADQHIRELEADTIGLRTEVDELKDSMVEDVYFKPIDNAINQLSNLRKSLEDFEGLISQDMMYTEDGTFTELGIAKYTFDVREYKVAQEELDNIGAAIRNLNKLYNDGTLQMSESEYQERLTNLQGQARSALTTLSSERQQIIKDITDRYQTEVNYINKLIDARKNELNKRKEIEQYDKKLKKSNKEIQLVEQQIRALNGLTDAESQAQKARLEARRAEMQEELDDTVKEHVNTMRIEGLSDLQTQMQENYEKYVKDLAINIDSASNLVTDSANNLASTLTHTNTVMDAFVKSFNPDDFWGSYVETGQHLNYSNTYNNAYFTPQNTTSLKTEPELDSSRKATYQLVHYEDNLSADELKYWRKLTTSQQDISSIMQRVSEANGRISSLAANIPGMSNEVAIIEEDAQVIQGVLNGILGTEQAFNDVQQATLADGLVDVRNTARDAIQSGLSDVPRVGDVNTNAENTITAVKDFQTSTATVARNTDIQEATKSQNAKIDALQTALSDIPRKTNLEKTTTALTDKAVDIIQNLQIMAENIVNAGNTVSETVSTTGAKYANQHTEVKISTTSGTGVKTEAMTSDNNKKTDKKKYAKGTTNAKGGLSLVNDGPGKLPEMIVTKNGILIPLAPGDGVVPGDLTAKLIEMAKSGVTTPEIKMPDINVGQTVNQNSDVHFDALINIQGNVDQSTIPAIKDIASKLMQDNAFKRNIYSYTSKEMAKDMRKAGY